MKAKDLKEGLYLLRKKLLEEGDVVETERWQGAKDHPEFLEIIHADLVAPMESFDYFASDLLNATQPWADEHFAERVGGIPCNPPPSHIHWLKDTDKYLMEEAFSHSYPERMWQNNGARAKVGIYEKGIRFNIGNLNDAVSLIKKEPTTRQCYIPIWFPEDIIAACLGERVPCTFGWHFMLRQGKLHCAYHMRSCDVMRHLHNDLYFANRLCLWLIEQANLDAVPGDIHFSATSLHCFVVDKYSLNQMVSNG
jgi:thymidylate synthase